MAQQAPRRRRIRLLKILALFVLLIPLAAYLFREPLFGRPLGRLAGSLLSQELGFPLSVERVGGTWFTSVTASGVTTAPPGPGGSFLALDLERVSLRYSLAALLLGRKDWLLEIEADGRALTLDLDKPAPRSRPSGTPRRAPGPPRVLLLDPMARIHLDRFTLLTGGGGIRFDDLRLRLDPGGALQAEAEHAESSLLAGEAGPFTLQGRRQDFRFLDMNLRLGRTALDQGVVDLTDSPERTLIKGSLTHPAGKLRSEIELTPTTLAFELLAEELHPSPLIDLPPGLPPEAASLRGSLAASGSFPMRRVSALEARWTLWLGHGGALLDTGRLAGRIAGGVVFLEESLLQAPGLRLAPVGSLSLEGRWEGRLDGSFDGPIGPLERLGAPGVLAEGRLRASASGSLSGPTVGEALLELDRLQAPDSPLLEDFRASLSLRPQGRLLVDSASGRLAGATFTGSGRLERVLDTPLWEGRLELEGLDLARLAPETEGRIETLALMAEGQGGTGSADLVMALDLGLGGDTEEHEAVLACRGAFRLGPSLLVAPQSLSGRFLGLPLQLLRPATVHFEAGTLSLSPLELSLGSSHFLARGVYPPTRPEDVLELQAHLDASLLRALLPAGLFSRLESAGLAGPQAPLSVMAELRNQGARLDLSGSGDKPGTLRLVATPSGKAATRLSLSAELGSLALHARLAGILPWAYDRLCRGDLPEDAAERSRLGLFVSFQGVQADLHPGLPLHGLLDGTLSLQGPERSLALTLSCPGLSLASGPDPFLSPWETSLEATWDRTGLWARGHGSSGPEGPRIELDLRLMEPFPGIHEFGSASLAESLLDRPLQLSLDTVAFPASLLGLVLEPAPLGTWNGSLKIEGTPADPRARLEAGAEALAWNPTAAGGRGLFLPELEVVARLEGKQLGVGMNGRMEPGGRFEAEGQAEVHPGALFQGGQLLPAEGSVSAACTLRGIDLENFRSFSDEILELTGTIQGEANLSGTWGRLQPTGRLELLAGFLKTRSALPALAEIQGVLQIRPDAIEVESFSAEAAGGRLALGGRIDEPFGRPRFNLTLEGRETLLVREEGLRVRADLDLRLQGDLDKARLSGTVDLTDGRFRRHLPLIALGLEAAGRAAGEVPTLFDSGGLSSLPGPASGRPPFSFSGPFAQNLELALDLRVVQPPFQVVTNLLRAPFQAGIQLRGTAENPWLEGDITAVDGGTLGLPSMTMRIQALRLAFDPSNPNRPRLYLVAFVRKHSIDVQLVAQGPLDDLFVELSSIPPFPREDLVLFITTGSMPRDLVGSRAALGVLGTYVGAELLEYLAGGDDGGEENGWFHDRVTVEIGTEVSREGKESIRGEFHLREILDNLYLQAERDTLNAYNLGLLLRWRWR